MYYISTKLLPKKSHFFVVSFQDKKEHLYNSSDHFSYSSFNLLNVKEIFQEDRPLKFEIFILQQKKYFYMLLIIFKLFLYVKISL